MTYAEIETEVRANINNTSATVSGVIDQAINLLSNFFNLKKIDISIKTVADQDYIDKPDCIEVEKVKIADTFHRKLQMESLEKTEKNELNKFYEYNDKIQIEPTPTEIKDCKIWYRQGFTPLGGVANAVTDVPAKILPLLILLASWLYWLRIETQTGTERELFPDMTTEEATKITDSWSKQFKEMLKLIKE